MTAGFDPVTPVKLRQQATQTELTVPSRVVDDIDVEIGDRLIPVVHNGVLMYIPAEVLQT